MSQTPTHEQFSASPRSGGDVGLSKIERLFGKSGPRKVQRMHRLDVKRIQIADALRWCGGCTGQGRLRVRDVMTPAPTCIASSTSVLDVVRMFHAKEFRHLLVTDTRGRLLGLVSDRDVLRCFGPGRYPNPDVLAGISAAEIMSADLLTVCPEQPSCCGPPRKC